MVSKFSIALLAVLLFLAFAGFAEASKLSHWWKSHNSWDDVEDNFKLDWHFTVEHSHPSKSKSFDSQTCGSYFWNVQDQKYCQKEWKKKGVYIRSWR